MHERSQGAAVLFPSLLALQLSAEVPMWQHQGLPSLAPIAMVDPASQRSADEMEILKNAK